MASRTGTRPTGSTARRRRVTIPSSTFLKDRGSNGNHYRGTVQLTTGFAQDPSTGQTVGRVFFAGTRYIPDLRQRLRQHLRDPAARGRRVSGGATTSAATLT
jgi:hypothetical protein